MNQYRITMTNHFFDEHFETHDEEHEFIEVQSNMDGT